MNHLSQSLYSFEAIRNNRDEDSFRASEAVLLRSSLMQHHDTITGTSRSHVTEDSKLTLDNTYRENFKSLQHIFKDKASEVLGVDF